MTRIRVPLLLALWSSGCASIIDVEPAERDPLLVDDGGVSEDSMVPDAQAPSLCREYCDAIEDGCTGESSVYASRGLCERVCALLPIGDPEDEIGNTIHCRLRNARLAFETGEAGTHCPIAGPGGGGSCGSNCESYCTLMAGACDAKFDEIYLGFADCMTQCEASTTDLGTYDVSVPLQSGSTVQCRLYHVSAATADPSTHCSHASGEPPCVEL